MMDRDKVKDVFKTDGGRELREEVMHRHRQSYNGLKSATELVQIGKLQGQLEVYDWLLALRED